MRPRKATRENAIKAANYVRDLALSQSSYHNQWFTAGWYEETWLYGGTGGAQVLDELVTLGVLEKDRLFYKLIS